MTAESLMSDATGGDLGPLPTVRLNEAPRLPADVHVWRVSLDTAEPGLAPLAATLDPAEQARAVAFHFARDRRRFIVSHAAVRRILAGYLDVGPADIRFTRGARGKPHLAPPFDGSGLHFNLSHAGELALLAVASGRPVGIDVETIRPLPDALSLAETFFAPAETAQLRPLLGTPLGERLFFTCWTRKEAFIKATGEGLARPLDSFVVSFLPDDPPALHHAAAPLSPLAGWTLIPLDPAPDYVGALVTAADVECQSPARTTYGRYEG